MLEKRIGLNLSKQDVYVNVIGGLEIDEPAADLGVALAVATCARDVCVSPDTVNCRQKLAFLEKLEQLIILINV